jgi:hypothetical protein
MHESPAIDKKLHLATDETYLGLVVCDLASQVYIVVVFCATFPRYGLLLLHIPTSPPSHIDPRNTMSSIFKSLSQPSSRRTSNADQTTRPINNEIFTSPEPGCGPKSPQTYTPDQEAKVSYAFTFASIADAGMAPLDRRTSQGIFTGTAKVWHMLNSLSLP